MHYYIIMSQMESVDQWIAANEPINETLSQYYTHYLRSARECGLPLDVDVKCFFYAMFRIWPGKSLFPGRIIGFL